MLFALGYEDLLGETFFKELSVAEDMQSYFSSWRNHPETLRLPRKPLFDEERKLTLESRLLGCKITVTTENVSPCIELAESLLAALESFVSTGRVDNIAARGPVLTIAVRKAELSEFPFQFRMMDSDGRPHVEVTCAAFSPHSMQLEMHEKIRQRILEMVAAIYGTIFVGNRLAEIFERLLRDERALDRSLNFTGTFITLGNVLGHEPKRQISAWMEPGLELYAVRRAEAWDTRSIASPDEDGANSPQQDGVPARIADRLSDAIKHTQIETFSLIRERLWEKANYQTIVFMTGLGSPGLAIAFSDEPAARQIFKAWLIELGDDDRADLLRVSIVRGVDESRPRRYRVIIGSNRAEKAKSPWVGIFVSRVLDTNASSDAHLERFLRSYEATKQFFLLPAFMSGPTTKPTPIWDLRILKKQLYVRNAWELGPEDPDGSAIKADETPVIPADISEVPVKALLARKRSKS
jgi:hypothetical protein